MTRTRSLLAAVTAGALLGPAALPAQQVPSLLVRVRDGGAPAAGLEVTLYRGGTRRLLGTTGASGLAVVEFGRVPVQVGTRLAVFTVMCPDRREIALTRSVGTPPPSGSECERTQVGFAVWSRTERIDVVLGETPSMTGQSAPSVVRSRSGWRFQLDGSLAVVSGDEFSSTNTGQGGELLGGYDASDGWGLGAGFAWHRHGLEGRDEKVSRFSVSLEPRYTFLRADWSARPYVMARAAREWLDPDEGAGDTSERGWSYGAGAGVAFPAIGPVGVDLHASAARISVGDQGFDRSGWLISFGVGFRF